MAIEAVQKKAKESGVSYSILKQVYDRGMGAYKTNPRSVRPNVTSPQQWALARVNSFLSGGKTQKTADKDLAVKAGLIKENKVMGIASSVIETATPSVQLDPSASIENGDMVQFRLDDEEVALQGLCGHVRNVRNGRLDIYVGSSLRASIDPSRVEKIVKG